MLSGRIEQENKFKGKINERLAQLPKIFTEFYSYMESENKSYATCLNYIYYVEDFMNFIVSNKQDEEFYKHATVPEIRSYITSLRRRVEDGIEKKNSDSIQATKWSAINTFYNFLVMDEYLDINPMTKTKRPKNRTEKPIVYLEQEEINSIFDKIRNESKKPYVNRDLALVALGVATGARVSALVQINVEDINFKDNTIHVIEKGNKDRYLRFGSNVRNMLSAWLVDRSTYFSDIETTALFISQHRKRMTIEAVRQLLKKYADGINGKHITPHTLRKSTATNMAKAGVDIQTIANVLNHNSINTTRRYAAVIDENKQQAINAIDNLF